MNNEFGMTSGHKAFWDTHYNPSKVRELKSKIFSLEEDIKRWKFNDSQMMFPAFTQHILNAEQEIKYYQILLTEEENKLK